MEYIKRFRDIALDCYDHYEERTLVEMSAEDSVGVVPAEGIEPPTFGLQNRCSTAELSRLRR